MTKLFLGYFCYQTLVMSLLFNALYLKVNPNQGCQGGIKFLLVHEDVKMLRNMLFLEIRPLS